MATTTHTHAQSRPGPRQERARTRPRRRSGLRQSLLGLHIVSALALLGSVGGLLVALVVVLGLQITMVFTASILAVFKPGGRIPWRRSETTP